MTYVAALAVSLAQLMRFLIIIGGRRKRLMIIRNDEHKRETSENVFGGTGKACTLSA